MEQFFSGYPALFLIITIGIIFGKLKFKGISLDLSAVIFVALVFGHFGVTIPSVFQKMGLVLFIYSIGIQAGPGFFSSFNKKGLSIVLLAVILVISGAATTIGLMYLFDIDHKIAVGLFAGALTSTPGLAAAIESTQSELASIGYGIAYPFGVVGVIIFLHLIPRVLSINIKTEETKYEADIKDSFPEIDHKHYIVENVNIINKPIFELKVRSMTGANISRVMHNDYASIPTANTILHKGDVIRAVGTETALDKIRLLIGNETKQKIELEKKSEVRWVLVTNKNIVNKTLAQLNLFNNYNATITRIRRSGIDITPKLSSHIRYGDKLLVACQGNMSQVTKLLGNEDKKLSETDFLPISLGIVLGIIVGIIPIPFFGGFSFKLGLTGGILITALVLSWLGKTGPIIWNVSGPANQLLRQLGLLLFLATVGTNAGANLVKTITEYGATLFSAGIAITLIPMILCTIIGYYFFKTNFLTLLGALTGGMTSTPGLTAAGSFSETDAANISYATVYPVAMVILIACTQLISML